MNRIKVIIAGSVDGKFKKLFEGVEKFHKKCGPFECLLCVGNFFGSDDTEWKQVKSGEIKAPVITYILGPNKLNHRTYYEESDELAPNINFLGKSGVLKCTSGLQVAYLSGVDGNGNKLVSFDDAEVSELIKTLSSEKDVDVLLTTEWPKCITKYDPPNNMQKLEEFASPLVAKLAQAVKPRYHFATYPEYFYASKPYRNEPWLDEDNMHITRFYSLDSVGGKNKWLYAFNITPASKSLSEAPTQIEGDVTKCPYDTLNPNKRSYGIFYRDPEDCETQKSSKRQSMKKHENKSGARNESKRMRGDCWFCLGTIEVNKHLIISVGEHSYLALAKGPLVPENVLILPIKHVKSSVELPDEVNEEINKFKDCLVAYFDRKGKDTVFFERNFCSMHLQIQVVPIPRSTSDMVKDAVLDYAFTQEISLTELSQFSRLKDIVKNEKLFFYIEIIKNKKLDSKMIHIIETKKFPLSFGRDVLASPKILNVPNRADWKRFEDEKDEETKMALQFKTSFKPHDFTL